jgi:hypothetical protein
MYKNVGVLFIIVVLVTMSCSVTRNNSTSSPEEGKAGPARQKAPLILFLDYRMIYDEVNESRSVELNKKILSEGTLKEKQAHSFNPQKDDLVFTVLDRNNREIHQQFIRDPLRRTVEFEDGDGNLKSRTIQSDSAHFFIRLQLQEDAASLNIQQISGNENDYIHLLTSPIR